MPIDLGAELNLHASNTAHSPSSIDFTRAPVSGGITYVTLQHST